MKTATTGVAVALALAAFTVARTHAEQAAPATTSPADRVARGEFLVHMGGCDDCHTTKKMGPNGPEPDMSQRLAGHPQAMVMPPAPQLPPGPWMATVAGTLTAWSGPWGVSFTANLTPDPETGLGKWTEEEFLAALQSGRHQGRGRQILPPMPWQTYSTLPEEELRAIWAYLRTVPPVKNKVPDPIAPPAPPAAAR
jgi:mono/diheme cytochrome c family protein